MGFAFVKGFLSTTTGRLYSVVGSTSTVANQPWLEPTTPPAKRHWQLKIDVDSSFTNAVHCFLVVVVMVPDQEHREKLFVAPSLHFMIIEFGYRTPFFANGSKTNMVNGF
ncbi:Hypothetical predicted protein [Prunus dulcis]|uniref:Uncharacterized protein n=1 Tax=Prunus dulcis TaxID=3755 RepID=A0A5E4GFX3_PRUDU|nr:Hypothetical predicted protein [Prunus dulcis]